MPNTRGAECRVRAIVPGASGESLRRDRCQLSRRDNRGDCQLCDRRDRVRSGAGILLGGPRVAAASRPRRSPLRKNRRSSCRPSRGWSCWIDSKKTPASNVSRWERGEEKTLETYGTSDEKGFVRIPLQQAMQIVVGQLPARKAANQPKFPDKGLIDAGESNSGRMFRGGSR